MSVVCIQCTTSEDEVAFNTLAELVAHEKGGHQNRPKKELPPSPPVTPSATELKEMKAKGETIVPQAGQTQLIPEKAEPIKPLELQYRWSGVHAQCNTEPRTIEVNLGDNKIAVVAFCFNCNQKLGQLEVPEIPRRLNTKENPAPKTTKKK